MRVSFSTLSRQGEAVSVADDSLWRVNTSDICGIKNTREVVCHGHSAAPRSCHVRSSVSVGEVGQGMTRGCFSSRRLAGLFWCVWKWQSFGPWTHKHPANFRLQHDCLFSCFYLAMLLLAIKTERGALAESV